MPITENNKIIKHGNKLIISSCVIISFFSLPIFGDYSERVISSEDILKEEVPSRLYIHDAAHIDDRAVGFFSKHIKEKLGNSRRKSVRIQKLLSTFEFELEYNQNHFVQSQKSSQRIYFNSINGNNNVQECGLYIDVDKQTMGGIGLRKGLRAINRECCSSLHNMAKEGNILAVYNLGIIYAHMGENDAVTYFKIAAKAGHKPSAIALASILRGGLFNEPKNPFLAEQLARASMATHDLYSLYAGKICRKVRLKFRDYDELDTSMKLAISKGIDQDDYVVNVTKDILTYVAKERRKKMFAAFLTLGVSLGVKAFG